MYNKYKIQGNLKVGNVLWLDIPNAPLFPTIEAGETWVNNNFEFEQAKKYFETRVVHVDVMED